MEDWDVEHFGELLDSIEENQGDVENESLHMAIKLISEPNNPKFGVVLSSVDRKIMFANKAIAEMFRIDIDSLIGRNLDWLLIDNETRLRLHGEVGFPGSYHIARLKCQNGTSFCLVLYRFKSGSSLVNIFIRTILDANELFRSNRFPVDFLQRASEVLAKCGLGSIAVPNTPVTATTLPDAAAPLNKKVRNVGVIHAAEAGAGMASTVADLVNSVKILDNGEESINKATTNAADKRRGRWTYEEDSRLLDMIKAYSEAEIHWSDIALKMEGRSKKQCKSRWEEHLCPAVNKDPFSMDEDQLIEYFQNQPATKNKWKAIAAKLSGRTGNTVKARWISIERRRNKKRKPTEYDEDGNAIPEDEDDEEFLDQLNLSEYDENEDEST